MVNHLEDVNVSSPETSPHRQGTLDAHVRSRISAELERLQAEEQSVREQIEQALERENLDRETALATSSSDDDGKVAELTEGGEETKNLASSVALQSELEEVQRKVERFQTRRQLGEYPEVQEAREAVIQCYQLRTVSSLFCGNRRMCKLTTGHFSSSCRSNPSTPLDCVESVDRFKQSVAQVERAFVDSLRS